MRILVDENIDGSKDRLNRLTSSNIWKDFRAHLDLRFIGFRDAGLPKGAPDNVVWDFCQANGYLLITDNRNSDNPDSLGEMIRTKSNATTLPVFTIGNIERFSNIDAYADAVIESMFGYLLELDSVLGTGRLFLPS